MFVWAKGGRRGGGAHTCVCASFVSNPTCNSQKNSYLNIALNKKTKQKNEAKKNRTGTTAICLASHSCGWVSLIRPASLCYTHAHTHTYPTLWHPAGALNAPNRPSNLMSSIITHLSSRKQRIKRWRAVPPPSPPSSPPKSARQRRCRRRRHQR